MTIVHYEHRYKRAPWKKPRAAAAELPSGEKIVTVTDPQLEKALREELVALQTESKRLPERKASKRKIAATSPRPRPRSKRSSRG
jgi:hypothetical protein